MADRMSDDDLLALVEAEVTDALAYKQADLSDDIKTAQEYYNGKMLDVPAEPNRSSVTSRDLADTVEWILPGLMRVFMSTDRPVLYGPSGGDDEQFARAATDYVNYKFVNHWGGYQILWDAFWDALVHRNGVVKHWWEPPADEKAQKTETYTGLLEEQYQALLLELKAEKGKVVALSERDGGMAPDGTPITYYDVKVSRPSNHCGTLKLMSVSPEDVLIDRNAISDDDARFWGHRSVVMRSDLVERGYSPVDVAELPAYQVQAYTSERDAREEDRNYWGRTGLETDPSRDLIEVFECYIRTDYDGDGIAEWRQVVYAGAGQSAAILANEEWTDDVPFTSLVAMPVPHRWLGRSVYDMLKDLQQIKTVLLRQTLDNLYATNNPMIIGDVTKVRNPDDLVNPVFGALIDAKDGHNLTPVEIPFVAANSFQMLEYLDMVKQQRTGVSRQSQALDPEALSNQSATQAQLTSDAAQSKIELIARNFAEIGLKKLFKAVLRLVVKHQDQPDIIRLRGKPMEVRPNLWSPEMDVSIDTGLGGGSRDRDLMALSAVMQKQELVMGNLGPSNPMVGLQEYRNALAKFAELSGIKSPEQFIKEIDAQTAQAFEDEQKNQPNPEQQKIQAQIEGENQKAQMQAQITLAVEQAKAQAAAEKEKAQAQADLIVGQQKLKDEAAAREHEHQLEMQRIAADASVRKYEIDAKAQLEREKLAQERSLELLKLGIQAQTAGMKAAADAEGAAEDGAEPGEEPMKPSDPVTAMFDQLAIRLADMLGQHVGAMAQQLAGHTATLLDQHTQHIAQRLSAPKRIVRGPDGRAIGVETVQ